MSDILQTILLRKRAEVAAAQQAVSADQMRAQALEASPVRGFAAAIRANLAAGQPALIAEIKRASPSKGLLCAVFEPDQIAQDYARAGASCLSVLTDQDFFQGDGSHLQRARAACELPVLRKDFIVDAYQIYEARALGADCVLLIVAALDDASLAQFTALAQSLQMDVLVEVHDLPELERALPLGADLIGVNNRNLRTFEVDLNTAIALRAHTPDQMPLVAESGISTADDIALLRRQGVHAFLVGEVLMRAEHRESAIRALLAAS